MYVIFSALHAIPLSTENRFSLINWISDAGIVPSIFLRLMSSILSRERRSRGWQWVMGGRRAVIREMLVEFVETTRIFHARGARPTYPVIAGALINQGNVIRQRSGEEGVRVSEQPFKRATSSQTAGRIQSIGPRLLSNRTNQAEPVPGESSFPPPSPSFSFLPPTIDVRSTFNRVAQRFANDFESRPTDNKDA